MAVRFTSAALTLVIVTSVSACEQGRTGEGPSGQKAATVSPGGQVQVDASLQQRRLAQTEGTIAVIGLKEDVRVVRDRNGIPHIYAKNADDLFFAQGFVQAQDRLFQIDLWRRSVLGRLAEILGPEFAERDRLARLMHYRGDMTAEWTSYAPDTKQIVTQFVNGINAWVQIARKNPPLEFTLAGYQPELWKPEDVLSRAEGFTMGGNALGEVFRSRLTAMIGLERATQLLPPEPRIPVSVPPGVDLKLIDERLQNQLLTIGAGARFPDVARSSSTAATTATLQARHLEGSNNWVVSGRKSVTGKPLLANDPHRNLDHPSLRYLVHLNAPGWNVIGAVQPYLPGVSVGHNDHVAWGLTIFTTDAQDLYVEKLNADGTQYQYRGRWLPLQVQHDQIGIKGQSDRAVEYKYTQHGPIVAVDEGTHKAIVLRWTGDEPGTVGYLGNLSLDRASNAAEFREALTHHKMPAENFVYADVDGNIGYQAAGLSPVRRNWPGLLPVPGWTGDYEWNGWFTLDDLPHVSNPASGWAATANNNTLPPGEKKPIGYEWSDPARINRIREVLMSREQFDVAAFEQLQHDAVPWNAEQLVPLLARVHTDDADVDRVRQQLLRWNKHMNRASPEAMIYAAWEEKLVGTLIADKLSGPLASEFIARGGDWLVPALTSASPIWFGGDAVPHRDQALATALTAAVNQLREQFGQDTAKWTWGSVHTATFRHPLAVNPSLASVLNIGPIARDGYGLTPLSTGGPAFTQTVGATFREVIDLSNWDRSVATSAPGQSGQPGSPHFADLATLWGDGRYFPLPYSDAAVQQHADRTLILNATK
jgi:penicillin G amidase